MSAAAIDSETGSAVDVLVVGGGINGAGIARDLAGRGLSVLLCERDDLAQHTSSCSTKLIHGGLRYLEHFEFSLVRKALAEREVLLKSAPHIMWPLRFVLPHDETAKGARPVWMIRAGLFLYDNLARRELLAGSQTVNLRDHAVGAPLKKHLRKAFIYSDGWVDDARLVVLNAIDAEKHGATVLTRTACVSAKRDAELWHAKLQSKDGAMRSVTARALVNAAGPWAAQFLSEHVPKAKPKSLRLVKGSHIVVRKMFDHDHAYIFQNNDKRIIFAIPYERDFTLIGTTDVEYRGSIGEARIDASEIKYLCDQANGYFEHAITEADVVWSYCGVRPLLEDASDDPSAVTRDYLLELDTAQAPLLNIWGGKITTFRKLAEEAADLLAAPLHMTKGAWTKGALLPGGDLSAWIGAALRPDADFIRFVDAVVLQHPQLPRELINRLCRAYGSRVTEVLGNGQLGEEIAPGLFVAELNYLYTHEWARSADDVLWRRSKLGLHFESTAITAVSQWCGLHWHVQVNTKMTERVCN
ncbi:MAG: glycerol-3-phosphate dehydrogenase [Rhizobacter sp.]|nr:glycerol-3-phosphate dehydrogenase [Burkholderiales bacterium]